MSRTFDPHYEVLPGAQRRLWAKLAPAKEQGFVLYGGTAIALQLGHRPSVDFDFFSDRPLDKAALREAMPFLKNALVIQEAPHTLTMLHQPDREKQPVKVSFFGELDFGRVGEPLHTRDQVLQVANLDDLLAHKLKVILQRIEAKDYQDIAALLRHGQKLSQGLAHARALFGREFQPAETLKALVYFEGGDLASLSKADKVALIEADAAVRWLPPGQVIERTLTLPEGPMMDQRRDRGDRGFEP